jgi:hypothetical protein
MMMAYSNNYVFSVLHNGSPVKEFSENNQRTCIVPFDQEYKIRLKNKSSKRAKVKVFIDGSNICSGDRSLILNPGQTLDLERWVDDNHSGKKFKFMSLEKATQTGEVNDPTAWENGQVKVVFYPEKDYGWLTTTGTLTKGLGNVTLTNSSSLSTLNTTTTTNCSPTWSCSGSLSDIVYDSLNVSNISEMSKTAGVTGMGSESSQKFIDGADFPTDFPTTLTLRLRGPSVQDEQKQSLQRAMEAFKEKEALEQKLKDLLREAEKAKELENKATYIIKHKQGFLEVWTKGKLFVSSNSANITIANDELRISSKCSYALGSGAFEIITDDFEMIFD